MSMQLGLELSRLTAGLDRLYREVPLNAIWEGSGNVICLDMLRSLTRDESAVDVLRAEQMAAAGADRRYDAALKRLEGELPEMIRNEGQARRLTERLALVLQGSLLLRFAPPAVADAFIATRLGEGWSGQFGDLPPAADAAALARRAVPAI